MRVMNLSGLDWIWVLDDYREFGVVGFVDFGGGAIEIGIAFSCSGMSR